jgi:glycosyltransferase involved in cell wall biosynthesis
LPTISSIGAFVADPTYTFTIFTSTRNRAHTLHRPFEALKAQTFRDFEWLVIDNGSTDGTTELIERYAAEADFPIRYYWQEDAGKQGSMNRAVKIARGALFVTLDSDDGIVPTALERLVANWESIPAGSRDRFTGVTALCLDEHGALVGTRFPFDPTDSDSREIRYRYKVRGEKWGFQRTDVLRKHLLPDIPGYRGLIPFSTIWSEIARSYKTRYVNEGLHVYWQDQEVRLSRPTAWSDDALGSMIEAGSIVRHDVAFFRDDPIAFVIMAIKYSRSAFHSGVGIREQWVEMDNLPARMLWVATLPAGWLVHWLERFGLASVVHRIRLLFA